MSIPLTAEGTHAEGEHVHIFSDSQHVRVPLPLLCAFDVNIQPDAPEQLSNVPTVKLTGEA